MPINVNIYATLGMIIFAPYFQELKNTHIMFYKEHMKISTSWGFTWFKEQFLLNKVD